MAQINIYKGQPTITLNPEDRFPFSFGKNKAQMILKNIEAIRAFVESDGETCEPPKQIEIPKHTFKFSSSSTEACAICEHEDEHYRVGNRMVCPRSDCYECNGSRQL